MKTVTILLFIFFRTAYSCYIFYYDDDHNKFINNHIIDTALYHEPPRSFFNWETFDEAESFFKKYHPDVKVKWIPPTLWQIGMLHGFFKDSSIQNMILETLRHQWDPVCFDDDIHYHLSNVDTIVDIVRYFDQKTFSIPNLEELYFQLNKHIGKLYKDANFSEKKMYEKILQDLPDFKLWEKNNFPFWKSPWIYSLNSPKLFHFALTNKTFIEEILDLETKAHKESKWILYRGYNGNTLPTTIQIEDDSSHALSFGSTLLGGAFFSLESCALTYATTDKNIPYSFLALKLAPSEMKKYFRVGPLSPFVQMLVDGEMFHAHTKLAADFSHSYKLKSMPGYFMKCNQHCHDNIGYILHVNILPKQFETLFTQLCKKLGHIFHLNKP